MRLSLELLGLELALTFGPVADQYDDEDQAPGYASHTDGSFDVVTMRVDNGRPEDEPEEDRRRQLRAGQFGFANTPTQQG